MEDTTSNIKCNIPNDRIVHHRLVRLVFEVGFPPFLEVRGWPGLKLLELGGSWANLDSRLDAVGGKGPGPLEIPLFKDP